VGAAQGCAQAQGLNWDAINACTTSDEGNQWEHQMGVRTDNLDPPHQGVPWIVVNGQASSDAQNNLQQVVCAAYTGPPPPVCSQFTHSMRTYDPVTVELYYESYCPYCQDFIAQQLVPTWQANGMASIMTISFIPYGNAQQQQDGSGQWVFTCQHGDQECTGNIIETCAIKLHPATSDHLPFIACMESGDPATSGATCAQQTSLDWDAINTCSTGNDGNDAEHQMGVRTDNLNPPHQGVPWIVVNGSPSDEAQNALLHVVCSAYQGPPPAACTQFARRRRSYMPCYRNEMTHSRRCRRAWSFVLRPFSALVR
jgi:interferon gamma-inducible protein 30